MKTSYRLPEMDEDKLYAKLSKYSLPIDDGIKIKRFAEFSIKFQTFDEIDDRYLNGAGNCIKFTDIESIMARKIDVDEHRPILPVSSHRNLDKSSTKEINIKGGDEKSSGNLTKVNTNNNNTTLSSSIADEIYEKHAALAALTEKFKAPETKEDIKAAAIESQQSVQIATITSTVVVVSESTVDNEIQEITETPAATTTRKRRKSHRKSDQITVDHLENLFKSLDESVDGSFSSMSFNNTSICGKVNEIIARLDDSARSDFPGRETKHLG